MALGNVLPKDTEAKSPVFPGQTYCWSCCFILNCLTGWPDFTKVGSYHWVCVHNVSNLLWSSENLRYLSKQAADQCLGVARALCAVSALPSSQATHSLSVQSQYAHEAHSAQHGPAPQLWATPFYAGFTITIGTLSQILVKGPSIHWHRKPEIWVSP